mgnify:CR=1 FL=1
MSLAFSHRERRCAASRQHKNFSSWSSRATSLVARLKILRGLRVPDGVSPRHVFVIQGLGGCSGGWEEISLVYAIYWDCIRNGVNVIMSE